MDATVASTTERGAGDRAVPPGWRVNPSAWDQRLPVAGWPRGSPGDPERFGGGWRSLFHGRG